MDDMLLRVVKVLQVSGMSAARRCDALWGTQGNQVLCNGLELFPALIGPTSGGVTSVYLELPGAPTGMQ